MPKLIGLNGYARSGKDTAAAALIERGWMRVAFADPLREMLLAIDPIFHHDQIVGSIRVSDILSKMDWDGAKQNQEIRRLLQRLGTEAGRNILGESVWIDLASKKIDAAFSAGQSVVITDVRFPNEADMIRQRSGLVVRIERDGIAPPNSHVSEQLQAKYVDQLLTNNSTVESLHRRITALSEQMFSCSEPALQS